MPNMSMKKVPMPSQDPAARIRNFDEVAEGYTLEMAVEEAGRCIGCKNQPCVQGCPVGVRIPEFIACVQKGDIPAAYEIIKSTNALPAVCGRVCPQENQCEKKCTRGIKGEPVAIGRLERFVADYMRETEGEQPEKKPAPIPKNGHKAAVIGAGPAGLTCAGELARKGYDVTVFEAFHTAGGVLMYGIPEFRLPKDVVRHEIKALEDMGVKIMTDMVMGKVLSVDELFEMGYESVFIGSGAGLPNFMGIPGENLVGVFSANEFLTRVNLMKAYRNDYDTPMMGLKRVAVVGGGNVTMDAARCARRFGAEVYIVYRRTEAEMPARLEEIHHAKEEGVEIIPLAQVTEIHGDEAGRVTGITCQRMQLGEPDASGRRRPVPVEGDTLSLDVDAVIMAIGNSPNRLLSDTTEGLATNAKGCIQADEETMETSRPGVFAGGDAVTGAATVILAMGAGKKAAAAMDAYMQKK
ncbi:MAG TPA: NADPH-dependent glutamate synthase [Firmicutes bacterium]|nr:NADPH-dependent glutamate synthase [Bacillota bacterium]